MQGGLALDLARDLRPVVVLLDIRLPDMNGADVLSALKAQPATSAVPVVIRSADATEGGVRRLLELGAAAQLTKPIDISQLANLLDRIQSERTTV